jgi:hypothetical protein
MAAPFKGAWAARYAQPYTGASVWGTGVNSVHAVYGSPADRLQPLNPREGEDVPATDRTQAGEGQQDDTPDTSYWGYDPEQIPSNVGEYIHYDDRPPLGNDSQNSKVRASTLGFPPLNAPGRVKSAFRSMMDGAHRINQKLVDGYPNETVSEGWINKATSTVADAIPADDSQVFMQTSMTQRYRTRTNANAVERGTDAPRSSIDSRVMAMVEKVYSTGERSYDMEPREQDDIPRPFYYRTAGTGDASYMAPNEMWEVAPIQRTPPADPTLGPDETDLQFGYTPEDQFYA